MDLATLRQHLSDLDGIPNETWIGSLNERKRRELEFHDAHRDRSKDSVDTDTYERFYGNRKYYVATGASKRYVDDWIEHNSQGRIFLDYACGNGMNAIKAAKAGAALAIGIDISRVSIENARRDAYSAGVAENTYFVQADAEDTKLPSASVDVAICSGMLHHLDLNQAFPELARVLNNRGKILAIEALDYNPAIKLYRYLTPEMRTEWETSHILSLKDVDFARRYFDVRDVRYWHIFSILGAQFPAALPLLDLVDRIATKTPLVQLMAWIFTFELHSKGR